MQEEEARWVVGDPGEVETVQRIFRRYASGEVGLRSLAVELNEDEIPAPQGGQWNDTTVRLVPGTKRLTVAALLRSQRRSSARS